MKTIYTKHTFIIILFGLLLATSCTKEADPAALAPVIKGLETEYFLLVNDKLTLNPNIENGTTEVEWLLDGKKVAATPEYTFQAPATPGISHLLFRAHNADNITQWPITITSGKYLAQTTPPGKVIMLQTTKKLEGKSVKWEMIKAASPFYRLSETEVNNPLFVATTTGTYQLRAVAGDVADTLVVAVRQTQVGSLSAYIAKVFDYFPAPGQYTNDLPRYEKGDTQENMNAKAAKNLVGSDPYMVTLGGWGGSVTFGFDHTITNVQGKRDFRVLGNAFGADANKRPNAPFGGSCEPGIIMVAYDKNKNGKPDDDEWYEIKGSGNFTAEKEPWYGFAKEEGSDVETYRDYEMTYYRPTTEETDADYVEKDFVTIKKYLRWTNNKGKEGYKAKNMWHKQTYFPAWVKEDKLTYKGIRLADNGLNEYKFNGGINETGMYYVLYAFRYGYVDNYPNGFDNSAIDIDWAIDKDGKPANLPGIDFVKVYNGVDKENGWLGECSTEIGGAQDLHMLGISIETIK